MTSLLACFSLQILVILALFPQTLRLDDFDLTAIATEELDQFVGEIHFVLEEAIRRIGISGEKGLREMQGTKLQLLP